MRNTKGHSTTVLSASRASTTSSICAVSSWERPSPSSTALLQTEYNADQDGQAWIGWDWASDDNLWHYPLGLGVGGVHRVNERGREVLVIPRRTMLPSVLLGSGWAARDSVAQKRHFRLIWALGRAVAIGMWAEVMDTHLGLAYKDTAPCSLHSACWSDVPAVDSAVCRASRTLMHLLFRLGSPEGCAERGALRQSDSTRVGHNFHKGNCIGVYINQ